MLANGTRIGGIAGILFVVLFIAGSATQGDIPMVDDSAADVREFWEDNSTTYLVGDWLVGVAFALLFIPFVSALRGTIGAVDPFGGVLARASFLGAILLFAAGLAASLAGGALALVDVDDLDDSTLLFATRASFYGSALAWRWESERSCYRLRW